MKLIRKTLTGPEHSEKLSVRSKCRGRFSEEARLSSSTVGLQTQCDADTAFYKTLQDLFYKTTKVAAIFLVTEHYVWRVLALVIRLSLSNEKLPPSEMFLHAKLWGREILIQRSRYRILLTSLYRGSNVVANWHHLAK